ncbi:hypothetical protein Tco_1391457 [Tanacetum coccineum]
MKEHEIKKKDVGSMYVEELIAWVEDEAKSPYLRSPPLKSRPLRNDYKGKILLTSMFNHDDEGFDYYPSLYDDELGQDNLVHRDVDNVVNMTGHNMEVDSVEDMNDAAKGVNINEEVHMDYARTLIDIRADQELKEVMVIVIPNVEDDGEVLHTVEVEYEWEPLMTSNNITFIASFIP